MKIKEKFKSKLLVEGNDDQHVIWTLCEHHTIHESFDVVDCESIENVFKHLELRVNEQASQTTVVGIVVDADADLNKRWNKITAILSKTANYTVPESLPNEGLVLRPNTPFNPIVGIWIMPDNKLNGMLEDFIATLVEADDAVLPAIDSTLLDIEQNNISKYKSIHKAKARIHTFLAWQEDPGTPMGLAITKKYLNPKAPSSQLFVNWLNALYTQD